jgi:hypothetical protein
MASGRKKPAESQEEGAPAWMNTYGDMVTLLLTFFVLLFSFFHRRRAKMEGHRTVLHRQSGSIRTAAFSGSEY